jgi:hypothetical protein
MANQYSNYSSPSLDGFDALLNSLPVYAPAPPQNTLNEEDPKHISDCYKVSNNKYPDCPAIMDDGRAFTDYRSACYLNNMLRVQNGIQNSYDYRQFLIRNGENIINKVRLYNIQKTSCRPCDAKPINCQNICEVDRQSVNCSLNDECGAGTCYKAVPLPPSEYSNRLSESRDFASFQ